MHLLARLAGAEPAIALQLAQISVPKGMAAGPPEGSGGGDPLEDPGGDREGDSADKQADLVALVAAAVAVLPRLPEPPIDTLGEFPASKTPECDDVDRLPQLLSSTFGAQLVD